MIFCYFLIYSLVLERKVLETLLMYFSISLLSTNGNGWYPSFKQTLILFTQGCFVPSLVEIGPVVREKIFKTLPMYFCHFLKISTLGNGQDFIWTNLNPLHPKMICAKFDWNWLSASGFFDSVNVFSLCHN